MPTKREYDERNPACRAHADGDGEDFQEVDRLGGTRADMEGEGHLVSQSAIGIAFRAAKRFFDITAAAVGMVRVHILSRIPETHLAKPTFGTVGA